MQPQTLHKASSISDVRLVLLRNHHVDLNRHACILQTANAAQCLLESSVPLSDLVMDLRIRPHERGKHKPYTQFPETLGILPCNGCYVRIDTNRHASLDGKLEPPEQGLPVEKRLTSGEDDMENPAVREFAHDPFHLVDRKVRSRRRLVALPPKVVAMEATM